MASARGYHGDSKNRIGKEYFVRQAAILFGMAKTTTDPRISAALLDQAADLKLQVDEPGARPTRSPSHRTLSRPRPAGKCFLDMLGVFAEFETNLRKERQLKGIAKAKEAGVYKGRPASIDAARVRELKAQGIGPTEIAKQLGIGRASVYRALVA
jgi:hypothetical protein